MQSGLWEGDRAVRGCRFDDAAAMKVAAMAGDLIQQGAGVDDGRATIPRCYSALPSTAIPRGHALPCAAMPRCHALPFTWSGSPRQSKRAASRHE